MKANTLSKNRVIKNLDMVSRWLGLVDPANFSKNLEWRETTIPWRPLLEMTMLGCQATNKIVTNSKLLETVQLEKFIPTHTKLTHLGRQPVKTPADQNFHLEQSCYSIAGDLDAFFRMSYCARVLDAVSTTDTQGWIEVSEHIFYSILTPVLIKEKSVLTPREIGALAMMWIRCSEISSSAKATYKLPHMHPVMFDAMEEAIVQEETFEDFFKADRYKFYHLPEVVRYIGRCLYRKCILRLHSYAM